MKATRDAAPQPPHPQRKRKLIFVVGCLGISGFLTSLGTARFWPSAKEDPPPAPTVTSPPPVTVGAPQEGVLRPIVIAIIDTGLDVTALDELKAPVQLWKNSEGRHGWNFADRNADLSDHHGHGTHVTGIIAQFLKQTAQGQDPETLTRPIELMILKYFDPQSKGEANLNASLEALEYAIDHHADIINYSGGGPSPSKEEYELVKKAHRSGILIVAAAGNNGQDADLFPFYPAAYDLENILSVGGLDNKGHLTNSSNYSHRSMDVVAPGEGILSILPDGKWGRMTGTSQATAAVSAYAARVLSMSPQPLSMIDLRDRILVALPRDTTLAKRSRLGAALNEDFVPRFGDRSLATGGPPHQETPDLDSFLMSENASRN